MGISYVEGDGPAATERYGRRCAYFDAVGDVTLVNETWGPSIGVGQIRSLRNPLGFSVADRYRFAWALLHPDFNACACVAISKGGVDFTPWSVYRDGRHVPHVGLDYELVAGHPRRDDWGK